MTQPQSERADLEAILATDLGEPVTYERPISPERLAEYEATMEELDRLSERPVPPLYCG